MIMSLFSLSHSIVTHSRIHFGGSDHRERIGADRDLSGRVSPQASLGGAGRHFQAMTRATVKARRDGVTL
jgi:hypothetical protein